MFILFLQADVSVQSPWYNLPVPHLELWEWLNNNVKYSGNENTPGMFAFLLPPVHRELLWAGLQGQFLFPGSIWDWVFPFHHQQVTIGTKVFFPKSKFNIWLLLNISQLLILHASIPFIGFWCLILSPSEELNLLNTKIQFETCYEEFPPLHLGIQGHQQ